MTSESYHVLRSMIDVLVFGALRKGAGNANVYTSVDKVVVFAFLSGGGRGPAHAIG